MDRTVILGVDTRHRTTHRTRQNRSYGLTASVSSANAIREIGRLKKLWYMQSYASIVSHRTVDDSRVHLLTAIVVVRRTDSHWFRPAALEKAPSKLLSFSTRLQSLKSRKVKILKSACTRADSRGRSDLRHRKHAESRRDGAGTSVLVIEASSRSPCRTASRCLQVDVVKAKKLSNFSSCGRYARFSNLSYQFECGRSFTNGLHRTAEKLMHAIKICFLESYRIDDIESICLDLCFLIS